MRRIFQYSTTWLFVILSLGCERRSESERSEPKIAEAGWGDKSETQLHSTTPDTLSSALIERISNVHATFADVDGKSQDEWISNFRKHDDPEGNLEVWENMKVAYEGYCNGRDLPLDTRRVVYEVLLYRSLLAPKDVLNALDQSILSPDEVSKIMELYPNPPEPAEWLK